MGSALAAAPLTGAPLLCLSTARAIITGPPQEAAIPLSHVVYWRRLSALVFQAGAIRPSMALIEVIEVHAFFLANLQQRINYASPARPVCVIALVIVLCA